MPLLTGGAVGFADGARTHAQFRAPAALALDAEGNLFIVDNGNMRIRKLSPSGEVSTVAGSGLVGWQDGPALQARFKSPLGVAIDRNGDLLVVDYLGQCIRKLDSTGTISTIAGVPGECGHCDGPAMRARFMDPTGIHVGPTGILLVVDRGNHCIRCIDQEGKTVSTLVGNPRPGLQDGFGREAAFNAPVTCASDAEGTLWICDQGNHAIRRVFPNGAVVTVAGNGTAGYADGEGAEARFDKPTGITLTGNGSLLVADTGNNCIRVVTPTGHVTTLFAPSSTSPRAKTVAEGVKACPCNLPTAIVITQFSELIISSFFQHSLHVVDARVPPYRRDGGRSMLAWLLSAGMDADVALASGEQRVAAHSVVLAARSPRFAELLRGDGTGVTPAELAVPGASLPELQAFLLFLYTSEVHAPEHLFGLLGLCQRFRVQDGCLRCVQYFQRHVQPSCAVQWLVESHRRGLGDLTCWLQQYVTQQWDAIRLAAPQTFHLMQPHPELLEATIPNKMRLMRNRPPQPIPPTSRKHFP